MGYPPLIPPNTGFRPTAAPLPGSFEAHSAGAPKMNEFSGLAGKLSQSVLAPHWYVPARFYVKKMAFFPWNGSKIDPFFGHITKPINFLILQQVPNGGPVFTISGIHFCIKFLCKFHVLSTLICSRSRN